jgi:hypothetical protein
VALLVATASAWQAGCDARPLLGPREMDAATPDARADGGAMADVVEVDAEACPDRGMACDTGNGCETGAIDCVGGAPTCVATGARPVGFLCRASASECDAAETCDGTSTA